jgi:hypothetical protein
VTNYKFDDKGEQPVPIIITEGKYEGIKIQYGKASFVEDEDNLRLVFDYTLLENPDDIEETQEFVDEIGKILSDIIENEMKEEDFLIGPPK